MRTRQGAVCVGWVFFRAANTTQALAMLSHLAGVAPGGATALLVGQRATIVLVALGCLAVETLLELSERRGAGALPPRPKAALRAVGYASLAALTLVLAPAAGPRFIYFQF
jgi:hypothetical protein